MENRNMINNATAIESPAADMLNDIKQKKSAIYHPPIGKYSRGRSVSTPKVYAEHKIQFGKPISYSDFKSISVDMKKEYLHDIKKRYPNLSFGTFAIMLNITTTSLRLHLDKVGIDRKEFFPGNVNSNAGYREDNRRFLSDMGLHEASDHYGKNGGVSHKKRKSPNSNISKKADNKKSRNVSNIPTSVSFNYIPTSVSFNSVSATINAADIQEFVDSLGIKGTVTITISI